MDYLPPGEELKRDVSIELAACDLEFRLKNGEPARVEAYLSCFPWLKDDKEAVEQLVRHELHIRSRRESDFNMGEIQSRFPSLNLADETDDSRSGERVQPESRYRLDRTLEEGGLGKVWLADDLALGRTVALKEIKQKFVDDPQSRHRFEQEARVTARLQHPGIVPIFSAGCRENGEPFYTMQLVDGVTLAAAIEQSRTDSDSNGTAAAWSLRQLIRRLITVCETIQYAHENGVRHRDIKPANIMLGRFGETFVIDWGLAKVVDQQDIEGTAVDLARQDEIDTVAGTVMGSLPYTSPEQAMGETEECDHRSDIYSLGATLYSILTGKTPPVRDTSEALKENTARRELRIDASVPEPLKSICRKAASRRPEMRYQSARELGNDLQSFLDYDTVLGHRESALERLARMVRRYSTSFVAALVVFILATAISTVAYMLIAKQRNKAVASAAEATFANDESRNFQEMMKDIFLEAGPTKGGKETKLVDVLVLAGEKTLENQELTSRTKAKFLDRLSQSLRSLSLMDDAVAQRSALELRLDDTGESAETARTLAVLGQLEHESSRFRSAVEYLEEAKQQFEALELNDQALRGFIKLYMGKALCDLGDTDDGIRVLEECVEELVDTSGGITRARYFAALQGLAKANFESGRYARAIDICERGLVELANASSDLPRLEFHNILGHVFFEQSNYVDASTSYGTALAMARRLFPAESHSTLSLRMSYGASLALSGDKEGVKLLEELILEFPDTTFAANAAQNNGRYYLVAHQHEKALGYFRESLDASEKFFGVDHTVVTSIRHFVAECLRNMERMKEAAKYYEENYEYRKALYPNDHRRLINSRHHHAACLAKIGRLDEAIVLLRKNYMPHVDRNLTSFVSTRCLIWSLHAASNAEEVDQLLAAELAHATRTGDTTAVRMIQRQAACIHNLRGEYESADEIVGELMVAAGGLEKEKLVMLQLESAVGLEEWQRAEGIWESLKKLWDVKADDNQTVRGLALLPVGILLLETDRETEGVRFVELAYSNFLEDAEKATLLPCDYDYLTRSAKVLVEHFESVKEKELLAKWRKNLANAVQMQDAILQRIDANPIPTHNSSIQE
ncbi:MAG: tetratricopeptide repeat protein [Planctomycetota bacterium]